MSVVRYGRRMLCIVQDHHIQYLPHPMSSSDFRSQGLGTSTARLSPTTLFFFFSSRRRHTRYWRDWSSDVCSSDLPDFPRRASLLPRALIFDIGTQGEPRTMQPLFMPRPALALAIALMPAAVLAQAQRSYDVAAGPLDAALRSTAAQAGVALIFTADQTAGQRSAGLRG